MTLLSLYAAQPAETNADAERAAVMNEVIDQVNAEYTPAELANPGAAERAEIQERVTVLVANAFRRRTHAPWPAIRNRPGRRDHPPSARAGLPGSAAATRAHGHLRNRASIPAA